MNSIRKVKKIFSGNTVIEGAGVKLTRIFGFYELPHFDPFLLLDHFKSETPDDFVAGFPWHPHRGIETVTYMLNGTVVHGDSLGNKGAINSGDVQWMNAGSGIIHQEMPLDTQGGIDGFQLWINLPASKKMTTPKYQEIKSSSIPTVTLKNKINIRIICGEYNGVKGPVKDIHVSTEYLDVNIPAHTEFEYPVSEEKNVFAYIYGGSCQPFYEDVKLTERQAVLFGNGNLVKLQTTDKPASLLLVSGIPLKERIAWRGPIVMNSEEEIIQAFEEYNNGTFIKEK